MPTAPAHPAPPATGESASAPATNTTTSTGGGDQWTALDGAADLGATQSVVAVESQLRWPDREKLLTECREMDSILAAVLLFCGFAYSAFGYTLLKLVAMANVAGLGVWAGFWVGRLFDARVPGMLVGGVLAAAAAWPAMRYTVALCAGLVGFVVGVAAWRSCGLLDAYAPAGGAIGAIFLFMLSFVLFKLSVITFTSVQGVVMLLGGVLGLLMKAPEIDEPVTHLTGEHRVVLPIAILALSVVAILFQHGWTREPAPGGGPAKK